MPAPTFATLLERKQNNFNLLRFLAAAGVIVSHAWLVVFGSETTEPLYGSTPFTLGQHAVLIFFSLSGFLVSASLDRSGSGIDFLRARILRVYPGLIVCLALTTVVLGPLVTVLTPGAYFSDLGTYAYFLKTVTVLAGNFPLPGVFETQPTAGYVNVPIWTLKYEVICYLLLAVLGTLGLFRYRSVAWTIFLLALAAYVAILSVPALSTLPKSAYHLSRLVATFFLGVLAYHHRERIPLAAVPLIAIAALTALLNTTTLSEPAWVLLDAYGAMVFAALPLGAVRDWTNNIDVSYGLYIYGWPIEQTLFWYDPDLGPFYIGLIAVILAAIIAWISWTYVEAPALKLKRRRRPRRADDTAPVAAE